MHRELPSVFATRLESFLRARLTVTNVEQRDFPAGFSTRDEIINTHRYILVLSGRLHYEVEAIRTLVQAKEQVLAPAWVRRRWSVPGGQRCQTLWCEFDADFFRPDLAVLFHRQPRRFSLEVATLKRLQLLWEGQGTQELSSLQLEGELKGSLSRFWPGAQAASLSPSSQTIQREIHPEVRAALSWLEQNYPDPGALEAFYVQLPLSAHHFRQLFRQATHSTVQEHLARLRLRRARHLVHHTTWPLKRIAAESGYADPLFFSRHYRAFWGHPPTHDRKSVH